MRNKSTFGDILKILLTEKGITAAELSRQSGIGTTTLNKYLNEGSTPGIYKAFTIAQALGVPVDSLVTGKFNEFLHAPILEYVSVPLLGYIPAGPFSEVVENHLDDVNVPEHLLSGGGDFYALRVKGESMINAGIRPGATAILRYQKTAESGDIVAIIYGGEGSLKRIFIMEHHLIIHSDNPNYPQITVPAADADSVVIAGKVLVVITEF